MDQESITKKFTTSSFRIAYDETEQVLIIDDGMNQQDQLLNFMLILTLINSILNIYNESPGQLNWHSITWLVLGAICAGLLIFKIFKKTAKKKIKTSEIVRLKETDFIGRTVFSLRLSNGKSRNLFHLKNYSEIKHLKHFLSQLGIQADK